MGSQGSEGRKGSFRGLVCRWVGGGSGCSRQALAPSLPLGKLPGKWVLGLALIGTCSYQPTLCVPPCITRVPLCAQTIIDRGELVPDNLVLDALLDAVLNPDINDGAGLGEPEPAR
jgi:hypothetical protein